VTLAVTKGESAEYGRIGNDVAAATVAANNRLHTAAGVTIAARRPRRRAA